MGFTLKQVRHGIAASLATFFLVALAGAHACDTPVYRYAMYRWLPAPYEVYFFHNGELGEVGEQMKAAIDKAGEAADSPTNLVFLPVDLLKDKDLTGVPPDVKEAWQKQETPTVPCFLVSSPVGAHLLMGELNPSELPSMTDSPLRQQIGKSLEAGNAGVYILLKGENAEANAKAEQDLRSVVDDVAAGKISLYSMPPVDGGFGGAESDAAEDQEAEQFKLSVGLLTLTRDDAKEKWLVDCLLAMEPDLRESKEPIVFMVYGRGRALFSCLGKGIHRDNLIQDVEFITGACSCTVKEQNPGVDLLMCYNWDAAAESLSRQFGTEEGSHYEFGGDALFPELIIPPEGEMSAETAADDESATADDAAAVSADISTTKAADAMAEGTTQGVANNNADDGSTAEETSGVDSQPSTKVASLTPPTSDIEGSSAPQERSQPNSFRGIMWVGAGLLGALILLFGATFVVLRPK